MDMDLIYLLIITLVNALVCICLPRVLTLIWSNIINRSWGFKSEGSVSSETRSLRYSSASSRPEYS